MEIVGCDSDGLDAACKTLLEGGVAVIPTDTVYGLAAHPDFPEAVERLYTIKGRSEKKTDRVFGLRRRGCRTARL